MSMPPPPNIVSAPATAFDGVISEAAIDHVNSIAADDEVCTCVVESQSDGIKNSILATGVDPDIGETDGC